MAQVTLTFKSKKSYRPEGGRQERRISSAARVTEELYGRSFSKSAVSGSAKFWVPAWMDSETVLWLKATHSSQRAPHTSKSERITE